MDNDAKNFSEEGNIIASSEPKKFRINAKRFFLTYPQCPIPKEQVFELYSKQYTAAELIVSQEEHKDGNKHLHVYLEVHKKLNIFDQHRFDIEGYHPNIQSVRDKNACKRYVKKDGNFIEQKLTVIESLRRLDAPLNAARISTDIIYYNMLINRVNLPEPPGIFKIIGNIEFNSMTIEKRRHLWFWGPPDCGKTTWMNETFGGTRVFLANEGKYPFENYLNERVIIYDDVAPQRQDLINATNVWMVMKSIGQVRYKEQYWEVGQYRTIIVLSNMPPQPDPAILSRFYVIEIKKE